MAAACYDGASANDQLALWEPFNLIVQKVVYMKHRLISMALILAGAASFVQAAPDTASTPAAGAPAAGAPAASAASKDASAAAIGKTLVMTDSVVGKGAEAGLGNQVDVHYTGWLYDPAAANGHGKQFDSSVGRDAFSFQLGAGRVIKGWDKGVMGMKIGGKRTLIIPAELGYGKRGAGGVIPPDAILVFDVELLGVK